MKQENVAVGQELNLLDKYPKSKRPIDERGALITEEHRVIARQFGEEYFDGDRLTGYGGYTYAPRFWTDTVRRFRDHYGLDDHSRILDVGCAKGFMMYDLKTLLPGAEVYGVDVSSYALAHAKREIAPFIQNASARELPFEDNSFDLVISINTIHNLPLNDCKEAFREIERVSSKHAFVVNDAWRSEDERERMLKWNLTALTYMHADDWVKLFAEVGYTGDYGWFIADSN